MHKVVCFLLFLFSLTSVFSDVFDSNELFQRLSDKSELTSSGWELVSSPDRDVLYLDGEIQGEKVYYPDGYEKISEERSERIFSDKDGNVVRRIIKERDKTEEFNYFYTDGVLSSYTYALDAKLVKKINYIDARGRLVALSGDKSAYLTEESVVYRDANGKAVAITTSDLKPVDSSQSMNEDGSLSEIVDGVLYTYSSNGRLESKEGDGFSVKYIYSEDGALISMQTIRGDIKTIDEFKASIKEKTTEFKSGTIECVRTYPEEGIVEEIRYLSGKPRYRMIFDMDGKRLKEVLPL